MSVTLPVRKCSFYFTWRLKTVLLCRGGCVIEKLRKVFSHQLNLSHCRFKIQPLSRCVSSLPIKTYSMSSSWLTHCIEPLKDLYIASQHDLFSQPIRHINKPEMQLPEPFGGQHLAQGLLKLPDTKPDNNTNILGQGPWQLQLVIF